MSKYAVVAISVMAEDIPLVREQLKVVARRFRRYASREPHEEASGEDVYMVDDSITWHEKAAVFFDLIKQLGEDQD